MKSVVAVIKDIRNISRGSVVSSISYNVRWTVKDNIHQVQKHIPFDIWGEVYGDVADMIDMACGEVR